MFGKIPARPAAGGVVDMDCDFTALDTIVPHPVYAWMGWVSVLNPTNQTFERLKPLVQEAYEFSVEKFKKRKISVHLPSTDSEKICQTGGEIPFTRDNLG